MPALSCATYDPDYPGQAQRIDEAVASVPLLTGQLIPSTVLRRRSHSAGQNGWRSDHEMEGSNHAGPLYTSDHGVDRFHYIVRESAASDGNLTSRSSSSPSTEERCTAWRQGHSPPFA